MDKDQVWILDSAVGRLGKNTADYSGTVRSSCQSVSGADPCETTRIQRSARQLSKSRGDSLATDRGACLDHVKEP
jgi:hypothetical protein